MVLAVGPFLFFPSRFCLCVDFALFSVRINSSIFILFNLSKYFAGRRGSQRQAERDSDEHRWASIAVNSGLSSFLVFLPSCLVSFLLSLHHVPPSNLPQRTHQRSPGLPVCVQPGPAISPSSRTHRRPQWPPSHPPRHLALLDIQTHGLAVGAGRPVYPMVDPRPLLPPFHPVRVQTARPCERMSRSPT